MKTIAIIAVLVIAAASAGAFAADGQWPAQMTLGNFQITGISGTMNANGSGSATGTLEIPRLGNFSVALMRSPQGVVTGASSVEAPVSGGALRGSFTLSGAGLNGRGMVECCSRSIDSPQMNISNRGEAKGVGYMALGHLNLQVDFIASGSSCGISGEAPVSAQLDTPMASYKLNGRLAVRTNLGQLIGTLSGQVVRTGKVSNQVTTTNIPNTRVDLSNGQCTVNVGGVSVTFSVL